MNYRHAFHAGNFADVVKHVVLVRILLYLQQKPTPLRVLDIHGGAGLYDLRSDEATRGGEWLGGIDRLSVAKLAPRPAALLAPYLAIIAAHNRPGELTHYPGSPVIAQDMLRPQDRLVACELEPMAAMQLAQNLRGDARSKAVTIDGWTALNAYLPPPERRGLVLIDPPFEEPGEFLRLLPHLEGAYRKWPTGTFLVWYPVKQQRDVDLFITRIKRSILRKALRAELWLERDPLPDRLAACGLMVVNPPWPLEAELRELMPALVTAFTHGRGRTHVDWLRHEN